ncbi:MAG: hypothetical protein A2Y62_01055 [Candidatus Fischerbacteria bacterium RBG_13_37_8]|uniref:Uncharacterized protein n=1 Tax=Candidatus Fischerbacteria bacterium RBG_13_37_8 TaxID=1817863 RepID=A0A1F5VT93_9BACT|nr:MAG: hypothetical protein A2Y62_01055 [Candidatus Fischerbacteria bacterium RBG_13_37_8]
MYTTVTSNDMKKNIYNLELRLFFKNTCFLDGTFFHLNCRIYIMDEGTTLFPRLCSEKGALEKSPSGTKAQRHKGTK